MGISSIDSRHRFALPHTPPELVSPGGPLYPPRSSEDRPRNSGVPISPPMSNYDPPSVRTETSSGRGSDESQPSREAAQTAPRQQLPSLSSLFGPPSAVRPLHSPHSEHPGSYTSPSPHERYAGPSPSLDRPFSSSSYFPPTTTPSAAPPRSAYEPRFEGRLPFGPLSQAFPGPLSPRTREPGQQRQEPGAESGHRWTHHQETRGNDYAPHSREGAYKPSLDRIPQLGGRKYESDVGAGHRGEHGQPHGNNQHQSSTPMNIVTVDGITLKDGLGPKIWTGTHFLPRFVRAAEVPGEGMCYFYDDGSHCKTVIDGEVVNAHWGVTKAGKPRKRLAIACITCREKKIKCDPDYPRCVQCEKFGRVCRFKNAPRGGNNTSPSTPPAEVADDPRQLPPLMRPPPDQQRPSSHSSESVSPRTAVRPASPEPAGHSAKRIRIGYEHYVPVAGAGERSPMIPIPVDTAAASRSHASVSASWQQQPRELPRIHEDVLCRVWQTDPYVSDPQSVLSTISSFFVHADATALRFLPALRFKVFVQASAHRKSPEDLMLVYSILALGVSLTPGGSKAAAHEYSEVARYAADRTALSLQLVQARILLSLYYLQVSRPSDANDMSSAAISTATCLQLNMELERSSQVADGPGAKYPFGMTFAGYAECRRRTFWSCFVLERLNGLFPARMSIINKEDIFIRLPRDVQGFESQVDTETPMFEPDFSALQQRQPGMHIMGYLVQIVALWGDVMTTIYRLAHRGTQYSYDFAKSQSAMLSRLDDWKSSLNPALLAFTPLNLHHVAAEEKGSFILMHLVYHLTMIKLHRHIHPRFLTPDQRRNNSLAAQHHADELLDVVCAVAKESTMGRSTMPPPFTSYAILESVDVLSAEGALSTLPRLVDRLATARSVIEILATVWDDATGHKAAMDHRLDKLADLRDRCSAADADAAVVDGELSSIQGVRVFVGDGEEEVVKVANGEKTTTTMPAGARWQMVGALEGRFPKDMDTVYTSLTALPAYAK
ncbi:fungal-specific transcription factor domain-containing protein [Coniochaeta sp. 2T2.1]|nr:fungal-specific transcription factor domain-containing protein [Coniochaeta sp. 2T2.1]